MQCVPFRNTPAVPADACRPDPLFPGAGTHIALRAGMYRGTLVLRLDEPMEFR